MIQNLVLTSDPRNWLLKGFFVQWDKYSPQKEIIIAGFSKPDFELPDYATFYSIGNFEDYPANKWSNALIKTLTELDISHPLIMLEDYWLTREINPHMYGCAELLHKNDNLLRFDVTSDRLYCNNIIQEVMHYRDIDVFQSAHTHYHVSLQAGVWNTNRMLEILIPDETPWQFEIDGSNRAKDMIVLGNRQWLMQYQIAVRAGEFVKSGDWMYPNRYISNEDWEILEQKGCLP